MATPTLLLLGPRDLARWAGVHLADLDSLHQCDSRECLQEKLTHHEARRRTDPLYQAFLLDRLVARLPPVGLGRDHCLVHVSPEGPKTPGWWAAFSNLSPPEAVQRHRLVRIEAVLGDQPRLHAFVALVDTHRRRAVVIGVHAGRRAFRRVPWADLLARIPASTPASASTPTPTPRATDNTEEPPSYRSAAAAPTPPMTAAPPPVAPDYASDRDRDPESDSSGSSSSDSDDDGAPGCPGATWPTTTPAGAFDVQLLNAHRPHTNPLRYLFWLHGLLSLAVNQPDADVLDSLRALMHEECIYRKAPREGRFLRVPGATMYELRVVDALVPRRAEDLEHELARVCEERQARVRRAAVWRHTDAAAGTS